MSFKTCIVIGSSYRNRDLYEELKIDLARVLRGLCIEKSMIHLNEMHVGIYRLEHKSAQKNP